jgi:hypothetical protein
VNLELAGVRAQVHPLRVFEIRQDSCGALRKLVIAVFGFADGAAEALVQYRKVKEICTQQQSLVQVTRL